MVFAYKLFWKELHSTSNNTKPTSNNTKPTSNSGLFTVKNMHKVLCQDQSDVGIKKIQQHLAEYDVELEQEILLRCLNTFDGISELDEYIAKQKSPKNLIIPYWNKHTKHSKLKHI